MATNVHLELRIYTVSQSCQNIDAADSSTPPMSLGLIVKQQVIAAYKWRTLIANLVLLNTQGDEVATEQYEYPISEA